MWVREDSYTTALQIISFLLLSILLPINYFLIQTIPTSEDIFFISIFFSGFFGSLIAIVLFIIRNLIKKYFIPRLKKEAIYVILTIIAIVIFFVILYIDWRLLICIIIFSPAIFGFYGILTKKNLHFALSIVIIFIITLIGVNKKEELYQILFFIAIFISYIEIGSLAILGYNNMVWSSEKIIFKKYFFHLIFFLFISLFFAFSIIYIEGIFNSIIGIEERIESRTIYSTFFTFLSIFVILFAIKFLFDNRKRIMSFLIIITKFKLGEKKKTCIQRE
ncbi:MAG: hypothetical protein AB1779_01285 [Candidatus Thermoplasmatota archaeon]